MLCALFSYSMLETMIAPALPAFQHAYGATPAQIGLVMAAMLLVGAIAIPLVGRLSDLYDKRHVLVCILAIASVGIVIAACAGSISQLAVGQAVQGVAMGVMPVAVGLMNESFPPRIAAFANGLIVGVMSLSTAIGLVAAGPMIELLGLRAIYWLPLALIVPCILCLARPDGGRKVAPRAMSVDVGKVDWIGSGSLAILLLALLAGLGGAATAGWQSLATMGPLAAFTLLLPLWVVYERRQRSPILDTRLLALPGVAEICLIALSVGFGSTASYLLLPMLLQADPATGLGFGANTSTIGLLMLPLGVASLVTAPLVGIFDRWWGARTVVCLGVLLATLGAGLPALFHSQMWHLAVSAAILGAGVGISLTAAMNTVVRAVHPDRAASTFAAVMLIRTFGGMLGSQVCMTVLTIGLRGAASGSASSRFTDAFALAAGGCALALIAGWRFPRGSMARAGEVPGATSVGEKAAVGRAPTSS